MTFSFDLSEFQTAGNYEKWPNRDTVVSGCS